jgi:hypothetical protein
MIAADHEAASQAQIAADLAAPIAPGGTRINHVALVGGAPRRMQAAGL